MNEEEKEHTYFILIKIGDWEPTRNRIADTFQNLKECFDWISRKRHQMVFTSKNSICSGFFLKTGLDNPHVVKAHILGAIHDGGPPWKQNKKMTSSCLCSGDSLLIVKIPDDGTSNEGFSRACTWLKHH